MYFAPPHLSLALSSDMDMTTSEKASADLLTAGPVRVIQLVEIPAPPPQPRRLPPSSASASSSSSSVSSSIDCDEDQDEDGSESYCSSIDGEDEEVVRARAAEASKMTRILAWRAEFAPLPSSPTASPTTPHAIPPALSRKRSASSRSSCSSTPHSKRSRTSASPAPSLHIAPPNNNSAFLTPPSPTGLARRHTSPRHHHAHSASLQITPSSSANLMVPQHHRALSFSAHADTLCPACDRRFSSKRAFRVHASLGAEGEGAAACGAAVAYAMEACGGPI
ncbi:hypothetical protein DFH07DRAFT_463253 [Mycena maculata]|uniref:Uncharacterized protein n=1 Tax=Mycena maculata TaxID=230809 RepID=A0AAD7K9Y7_9AGAR|nr:hypothetical protein DFH07DRAFT_463253 [Mycena maculata]